MQTLRRNPGEIESWTLPRLGCVAESALPDWLIAKMEEGVLVINRYGGLTITDESGTRYCQAGDTVVRNEIGHIEFFDPPDIIQVSA